jgi:hypothetical protein
MVLSHAHDEVQDRHVCANGIGVTAEHDVAESNVVVCGDMASCHTGER